MPTFVSTLRRIFSDRNMAVLTLGTFLFFFGGTLWWPFQPLFIIELGASKEILGILLMLQSVTAIIFQLPGGVLADRIGRKKVMIYCSLIRCIPPLIYAAANNWILLIPAIIIDSSSLLDMPASVALTLESLPSENRGAGYGVFNTLTMLPRIFTMPVGGFLMDLLGVIPGMRVCFIINEAVLLLVAFLLWKFVSETRSEAEPQKAKIAETKRMDLFLTEKLKLMPKNAWFLVLVGGIISFTTNLSMSYMVVYAVGVIGLSNTEWGIIGTVFSLLSTVLTTPTGFLADRVGRKSCIAASHLLVLVSAFGFISSRDFAGVLVSRVLEGLGSGLGGVVMGFYGGPVWQALIADIVPSENRGTVMGLIQTITGALGAPSYWVGGHLYDAVSPVSPFQVGIVLRVLAFAVLLLFLKEPKEKAR